VKFEDERHVYATIRKAVSLGLEKNNLTPGVVFKKQENDADLPEIKGTVGFSDQMLRDETILLKFRNGKSALTSHAFGNGKVYTFAFQLNNSNFNFVRHLLFVPTIYNMVLNSGANQAYAYSTENKEPVVLNSNQNPGSLKIINLQTKDEFLSSVRTIGSGKKQLLLDELQKEAGHYLVKDGDKILQSVSFNYPRIDFLFIFKFTIIIFCCLDLL